MPFSEVLELLMTRHGLTMADLSRSTGVDHSLISRYCVGARSPTRKSVDQLVRESPFTRRERRLLYVAAGFVPPDMRDLIDFLIRKM